MATIKAVRTHTDGRLAMLVNLDAHRPEPCPHQGLVWVHETSVNPVDRTTRQAYLPQRIGERYPQVLDRNVAKSVVSVRTKEAAAVRTVHAIDLQVHANATQCAQIADLIDAEQVKPVVDTVLLSDISVPMSWARQGKYGAS